ncbi:winged helix-turn-helix transcriptional regulator [Microbacterium neimengense]
MSGYHQFCGLAVSLDLIGDRWNLLIVRELLIEPRRFRQLRTSLPGAASNLLTSRLRDLQDAGIVSRAEDPGKKAVVYSLTPRGAQLREPVFALIRWGAASMADGPREGDTVRGEWVGLAAEALLSPGAAIQASATVDESSARVHVELGAESAENRAVLDGPPAAVLGAIAGALPIAAFVQRGGSIEDPDDLLGRGRTGIPS